MNFRTKTQVLLAPGLVMLVCCIMACKSDTPKGCGPVEFSKENTVTTRMIAAATIFSPFVSKTGYDNAVSSQIIMSLGGVEPKSLELMPLMIKKIPTVRKVSDGPYKGMLAYDFELYDDATWDNGSPVTANDVVFSFKILFHPGVAGAARFRGYFEYVKGVEPDASSPQKFTVYISQYYMLTLESLCQFPIYPVYNYDPQGALTNIPLADFLKPDTTNQLLTKHPELKTWAEMFESPKYTNDKTGVSGCGPYRLESLDVDQGCVLVKKQNWWGDRHLKDNPYLGAFPQKLVYRYIKDAVPVTSLIQKGELDLVPDYPPDNFLKLKKDSCLAERYNFTTAGSGSYARIMLNCGNPKLADKRVRQALAYAVDYDYIVHTIYQDLTTRIVGPVNPAKPFYARNIKLYDYNIQKAKELLAAAGWKDSNGDGTVDKIINGVPTELELSLLMTASAVTQQTAKSIATTARNAGIKIVMTEMDIAAINNVTRGKLEYEMAISGSALFPGLYDFYQTYDTKSIGADNRFNYSNPTFDALIEKLRVEEDEGKRNAMYIQAQQILYEDLPELYLHAPLQRMIVSKRFNAVLSANRPGYYEHYFRLIQ